jgi:hypothetical protein
VVEVELLVRGHHQTTERTVAIDCGWQECSSALLTLVAVAASGGECAPVAAVSLAARALARCATAEACGQHPQF